MSDLIITTFDPSFTDLALKEIQNQAAGKVEIGAPLAPGVYPITISNTFWGLAGNWQKHPPIFVRHINPAQFQVQSPTIENLLTHTQSIFADLFDPALSFSVQTRLFGEWPFKPFDVNTSLSAHIIETSAANLDIRQPRQVFSVVLAHRPDNSPVGYLGLSLAEHNLSDWAGGVRRFKREKEQISRAEFKLLEAFEQFQITLPSRGIALDLGAAPGGWTRILRRKEQYVTAIDPAALHTSLRRDPGVRHIRQTAEAYLESYPDQFDLIVNDMRLDARDSARLMVRYRPYLYPDGNAIITLKLPADNRENIIDHSFNILLNAYTIKKARQLFHNRSEITIYLQPLD